MTRPEWDCRSWRPWMDHIGTATIWLFGVLIVVALIAFWLVWDDGQDEAKAECERNGGRVHVTSTRVYSWTCIPGPR